MTEILDIKAAEPDELDQDNIIKNLTGIDDEDLWGYIDGCDVFIEHMQKIVRVFSAFKCPDRLRILLSDPELTEWQIRDISRIASRMTQKPDWIQELIDEIIGITMDYENVEKVRIEKKELKKG